MSINMSDELSMPASAVNADKTVLLFGVDAGDANAFVLLIAFVLLNNRAIIATFCDSEQSVRFNIDWILFLISGIRSSTCSSVDVVTGIGARGASVPGSTEAAFNSMDALAFNPLVCTMFPPQVPVFDAVVAAPVAGTVGAIEDVDRTPTAVISLVRLAA